MLHSHTVLIQLYPCGRYRQLNKVLYPNNHVLNSSKIIFNRLIFNLFLVLGGYLKVGKSMLCFLSSKLNAYSFIRSIYHNRCVPFS